VPSQYGLFFAGLFQCRLPLVLETAKVRINP
jgi:hypothetical protein